MSIKAQLKALAEQKTALLTQMEEMASGDDALDEGEQTKFDDIEKQIKTLNLRQENLEKTEKMIGMNKAQPIVTPENKSTAAVVTPQLEQDKSLFVARQAHALYMTGGSRAAASQYAKDSLGDDLLAKTLSMPADVIQRATVIPGGAGVTGFAEELVQINQANEAFIELLRPMSVLANFPGRPMSFDGAGSIKIPRQTVGSTGGWIGEGGAIKVDRLTLDSVELTPKKNANIIAVSNELLARSTPSAMAIIRDDILRGIATSIDTKFLSSDAASAGVSPAGIQTYDGSSTASAGDTLDNITTDLKAAIAAMLTVNMPMARPIWLINPIRLNALKFIRDGLGAYAFKDEINQGTLAGYPYLTSTSVTDSVVMLVDAAQVIIATELAPEISISQDATIHMSDGPDADIGGGGSATPVQSMFQTDSTAVKAITRLDFAARYAECTQVITGVSWA